MSKRVKITFESVNKGRYTIISRKDIYQSLSVIRKDNKVFYMRLRHSGLKFPKRK